MSESGPTRKCRPAARRFRFCRSDEVSGTAHFGPTLPTWALQQVVSYLGYTGRDANVVAEAAFDPMQTFNRSSRCNLRNCNRSIRAASDQKVRRLESSLISYFHLISGIQQSSGIGHLRAMRGRL
jgi:hypothetical protein